MFKNVKDYQTDEEIELKGVELAFGKDRYITIRRAGGANVELSTYTKQKFKPYESELQRGVVDEKVAESVMFDAYAKKVVIGWRGWLDEEGVEVEFTSERCIQLFKEAPEIYRIVYDESTNLDNFREEEVFKSGNE